MPESLPSQARVYVLEWRTRFARVEIFDKLVHRLLIKHNTSVKRNHHTPRDWSLYIFLYKL